MIISLDAEKKFGTVQYSCNKRSLPQPDEIDV